MEENYVLEKPVFIENSFVFPIYNQTFSRELMDISSMLNSYISDKKIVTDISDIALEINQINSRLLEENDFESYMGKYLENCIGNPFKIASFIDVNPNARFNTTFIEYQSQRIFLPQNNEIYIGYLYRKMMNYCDKQESIALYFKFMFISRFLGELIWKNHSLSEKFRDM